MDVIVAIVAGFDAGKINLGINETGIVGVA